MTDKAKEFIEILSENLAQEEKVKAIDNFLHPKGKKSATEANIGDVVVVPFPRGYGNHSARVEITKVNRKSLVGYEISGSYAAGRKWRIDKEGQEYYVDNQYSAWLAEGKVKSTKPENE